MIIWFACLVPIAVLAFCLWKFKERYNWIEILVQLVIPILLIFGAKLLIESTQTSDTEYWGGWAVRAEHYEDWNERVPCSHPEYRTEYYTDSNGNSASRSVYVGQQHAYDVDYHPEYWEIDDSNGLSIRIASSFYSHLAKRWGNNKFVDLKRDYHSNDGDKHVTIWDGKRETLEACTTEHSYENRVAVSDSVFNFPEVENPQELGLYEYPGISGHSQKSVLGNAGPGTIPGEQAFGYYNATLGRKKQVKLFMLIYRDQPMPTALDQEAYWKGGNKNELVSCVGVDKDFNIQWSYIFSWSKSEVLKAAARDHLQGQKKLDLVEYANWLGPEVDKSWERFEFKEFEYLTVTPPWWAVLLVYIISLIVAIVLSLISIHNSHDANGVRRRFRWERFRS